MRTTKWKNFKRNLEEGEFLLLLSFGAEIFSLLIALFLTILVGAGAKFFLISTAALICVGGLYGPLQRRWGKVLC